MKETREFLKSIGMPEGVLMTFLHLRKDSMMEDSTVLRYREYRALK